MYEPQGSSLLYQPSTYWTQRRLRFVVLFLFVSIDPVVQASGSVQISELDNNSQHYSSLKKSFSEHQNSDKTQQADLPIGRRAKVLDFNDSNTDEAFSNELSNRSIGQPDTLDPLEVPSDKDELEAPPVEQRKLLSMHRFLALRFLMALNDPTLNPDSIEGHPVVSEQLPVYSDESKSNGSNLDLVIGERGQRKAIKKIRRSTIVRRTNQNLTAPMPVIVAQANQTSPPSSVDVNIQPMTTQSNPQISVAQCSGWEWIPEEFKAAQNETVPSVELEKVGSQLNELLFSSLQCHLEQFPADKNGLQTEFTWLAQSETPAAQSDASSVVLPQVKETIPMMAQVLPSVTSVSQTEGLPPSALKVAAAETSLMTSTAHEKLNRHSVNSQMTTQMATTNPSDIGRAVTTQRLVTTQGALVANPSNSEKPAIIVPGTLTPSPSGLVGSSAEEIEQEEDGNPSRYLSLESTYVEAFDANHTVISDVQSKMMSMANERGWKLSSQTSHWPTLSWVDPLHNFYAGPNSAAIPLLHYNTIRSFEGAALGDTIQQQQTGIVFGKIAAGWEVRFSEDSRTEQPILLSVDGRVLRSDDHSEDRYFIYLNVAPGAHLVYLTTPNDPAVESRQGALAIPALSGTATYVDLTQIKSRLLSGVVINAGSQKATQPHSGVTVQVAGLETRSTISDKDGYFAIKDVVTAASYPVVLESEVIRGNRVLGFKHRYQVLPENLTDLPLFRMPSSQIKEWVGSLQGGVSAESGLILAAVPGVVSQNRGVPLSPSVISLASSINLVPETYTLSRTGELKPPIMTPSESGEARPVATLDRREVRFLATEIPEGLAQAKMTSSNAQETTVWAELIISSPGVINMVGPY